MQRSLLTTLFLLLLGAFLQAQSLGIHHINVGQGDATLIVSPTGKTLLIDAGGEAKGKNVVLPYLRDLGITSLNYVIATHYHSDHIGGLDEVITGLGGSHIGKIYDRGTTSRPTSTVYTRYASAAASVLGGRATATVGMTIDLGGGVSVKCVANSGEVLNWGQVPNASVSENDLSNAWLVTYNHFRYYTGGDCGGEHSSYVDLETPISMVVGEVDACKIDHHGSICSTNQTFVNTLNPTAAVITVGIRNTYKHPAQSVLDRLAASNCFMYLTEIGSGGTLAPGTGVVADGNVLISTTGNTTYSVFFGPFTDTYTLHR